MNNWQIVPLSSVIVVQSGYAFKSADYTESGHFLMRIGNVQEGLITLDNPKYIRLEKRTKQFELREGDILTSLTGNIGRVAKISQLRLPAALNQRVAKLRVKATDRLDEEYLFYFLSSLDFRQKLSSDGHGAAQQNVSPKAIGLIPIPLPPLEEQRRIVSVLDEAFAAIATAAINAEKNHANAREMFASALSTAFDGKAKGWPLKRLAGTGVTVTGSTPKTSVSGNFGSHIPFIKPGDFRPNGSLEYENEALSEDGAKGSRIIPAGSALMVCIGATIGKSGYAEQKVAANQQVNAFIPGPGISGKFVFYQFLTPRFQLAVRSASGQATLPIINKSKWTELEIYVPESEHEQHDIVKLLDGLMLERRALEAVCALKAVALERLKQAILQKAFAGDLAIRELIAV